ncbi:hypothetical protein DFAR_2220018 [Desulfarculales bacterium]
MNPSPPASLDSSALLGLNEGQAYAVGLLSGPILVIAGAGTGKTRTLVHRVAFLVEQGVAPTQILLLTFTRKATAEMLTRARQLHPSCATVEGGTFHSLCHRLLSSSAVAWSSPPTSRSSIAPTASTSSRVW